MNTDRINHLIHLLRSGTYQSLDAGFSFNMEHSFILADETITGEWEQYILPSEPRPANECGSVGCIMGLSSLAFGHEATSTATDAALGINTETPDPHGLWGKSSRLYYPQLIQDDWSKITPELAAQALERIRDGESPIRLWERVLTANGIPFTSNEEAQA